MTWPLPNTPYSSIGEVAGDEWALEVGEPLEGWRIWRLGERHDLAVLESIYHRTAWPRGKPMRAHCIYQWRRDRATTVSINGARWAAQYIGLEHSAPGLAGGRCRCGIYAVKRRDEALEWMKSAGKTRMVFLGRVALWGRIARHELGYRAEYAYPLSLIVVWSPPDDDPEEISGWIGEAYGVPVGIALPLQDEA